VLEHLQDIGLSTPVLRLGLPDQFVEHGESTQLLAQCGLDAAGIEQAARKRFGAPPVQLRPVVNG
jgi:1-deoxy-D-xylulose-5-phosphate synthase